MKKANPDKPRKPRARQEKAVTRWRPFGQVIGRILCEVREDAGLNQDSLAQKLHWGETNRIISDIEKGKRSLLFVEFVMLAKFLDKDPHELLDEFMRRAEKRLDEVSEAWEPFEATSIESNS